MRKLLEVRQLQKEIDDFKLGPIDFTVKPGTITALVGNNGSGKSTFIKLIMNLAKSDGGTVKVCDKIVGAQDEGWKKEVAYQPQTAIGSDAFNGIILRDLVSHFYPNWNEELFTRVVQLLEIDLKKRYGKLSQGSQQKLNFALTIARNAPLLILDEPTAHIDILSKKIIIDLLVDWMEEDNSRAIIIASHQIEDIRKLSDYLYVLNNGQPIGHFEKESLTESYRRYFISETIPEATIPGVVSRESHSLISNQPEETEHFLAANHIEWSNRTALELAEIITILLTKNGNSIKELN
jgi:ABC-2 type transport system ATP-binding protein